MEFAIKLAYIGIIVTVVIGFLGILAAWYFSPKRKLTPKEILGQFRKHIAGIRCPDCASRNIVSEDKYDIDEDGIASTVQTEWECKRCKHT